jgi:hypothetical protein
MKKLYSILLALFSLCQLGLRAQAPYNKLLGAQNTWYVSGTFHVAYVQNNGRQAASLGQAKQGQYDANRDSILNAKTYKIFEHIGNSGFIYSNGFQMALIREDTITRKVYMVPKDSTTERIVMDFSLQQGDSIYLTFPSQNYSRLKSAYYKVDSVKMKLITIGTRKHIYLTQRGGPYNSITNSRYFLEWIESVGAVHFPINCVDDPSYYSQWYQVAQWTAACKKQQYGHFVSCKSTNGIKYYHDTLSYNFAKTLTAYEFREQSTCSYYLYNKGSGLADNGSTDLFKAFPNPCDQSLNITASDIESIRAVSIYNSVGMQVPAKSEAADGGIKLSTVEFLSGVYIVTCVFSDGKQQAIRFSVSH